MNGGGNGLQLAGTGTGNLVDLNGNILQLGTGTNIQVTGTQNINSATGTGIVKVQSGGTSNVNGGTSLVLSTDVRVELNGVINFGAGLTTINGTLQLNSGGTVTGNAPIYGSGSTLKYNSGSSPFIRGIEWGAASGPAYPYDVQVSNNTVINPGGSGRTGVALNTANNLTIDAGSAIYMDYGGNNMTVPLVINGSLFLNGSLSASGAAGGDIKIRGNWTNTGSFFPNSRAVFFDAATGTQTITKAGGQTFDYLIIDKAAGLVQLANDINIAQALTLSNGTINTAANLVNVTNSAAASVIRTNGYVVGNLKRAVATGTNTYAYPVGTTSGYTPAGIAFSGVAGGGNVTVVSLNGASANYPSALSATRRLARYWIVTNAGVSGFTASATFNYLAGDLTGGATQSSLKPYKFDAPATFSYPASSTATLSFTETGISSFSEFGAGECGPVAVSPITGGGASLCAGATQQLSDATSNGVWSSDGPGIATVSNSGLVTAVAAGTTVIRYSVTDVSGCSGEATQSVTVLSNYTIIASAGAGGAVAPNGSTTLCAGTNQTYSITPDACYSIAEVLVDGVSCWCCWYIHIHERICESYDQCKLHIKYLHDHSQQRWQWFSNTCGCYYC